MQECVDMQFFFYFKSEGVLLHAIKSLHHQIHMDEHGK